jgi:hypothetical protein
MLPLAAVLPPWPASHAMAVAQDITPLPFHDLAERVTDRYEGRLLAAGMSPPSPAEEQLGVRWVYAFRLMTDQRNLLNIRLDAETGRFLEVAGRGQIEALKHEKDDD